MVRRLRIAGIVALVAVSLVSGCGPEPEPEPDFVWRGDNLDIYGYDVEEDYYCGGTLEHMDEFMGRVSAVFGSEHDVKPIVRVGPPEFYQRYCPASSIGCIDYPDVTVIRADRMPLDHELVHLAEQEVTGCPVFLAEGLVEYYALSHFDQQVEPWNIQAAIDATLDETMSLPGQHYSLAGHFAAFLVETRGLEQLLRVCDRTGGLPTRDQFYEAFEHVYGQTLDSLIEEHKHEYPICPQGDLARKLVECDRPLDGTLEHGQTLELEFDVDCANSQTLGPTNYGPDELEHVWVNKRIELAPLIIDHRVAVRTADEQGNPTPAVVTFMACKPCIEGSGEGFQSYLEDGGDAVPWEIKQGLYVISVRVPLADAKRIHLTLTSGF